MTKRKLLWAFFLLIVPASLLLLLDAAEGEGVPAGMVVTGPGQRYTENIPVIDIRDFGYQPVQLSGEIIDHLPFAIDHLPLNGGSDPDNPYAVIRKTAPAFLHPGATAHYKIRLANYESVTHTYQLTDTLPAQLAYIPNSSADLTYDPDTRTLTWQGELPPGHLDYVVEESSLTLPYLDLADFGAVNLCDDFIANGEDCDDVTVTFNLGVNGYYSNLYGEVLHQLTVSSNGLVLGIDSIADGRNQWLPDATTPGFLLAGLWRDANLTSSGRWHAAIISGLVPSHDVFYAQWHNAPHANDPDLTARHAIAVLLNGDASAGQVQSMAGHAFFIYDNIPNPAQTIIQGYTIGIEDKSGLRGMTYAYAPCCGDPQPPQGYPPPAGTTLHLRPVLFGATNDYSRTFSYEAVVDGRVPETITSTAVATSSSGNPALAYAWSTHYLHVRWQTFLPLLTGNKVAPSNGVISPNVVTTPGEVSP